LVKWFENASGLHTPNTDTESIAIPETLIKKESRSCGQKKLSNCRISNHSLSHSGITILIELPGSSEPDTNPVDILTRSRKQSGNTFLANVPKAPKQHCFSEGSQVTPVCPSGKSNIKMKMSTERWWNDSDREKMKYLVEK